MSISHKYKTFDQLYNDVIVDFATYNIEGFIDPAQLIKVAARVNYDLGLRINRTKEVVLDIEYGKSRLPYDFAYLNYTFRCGTYTIADRLPSGTHVQTFNDVPYVPSPSTSGPCNDPTCTDVCVIKTCQDKNEYQLVQKLKAPDSYRVFTSFTPLRIKTVNKYTCDCPNVNEQAHDIAEIKDGFILTTFETGKVYLNYQSSMEDYDGNLLVLDHPYCNEYYEYALKQRIVENMIFAGENVTNQLALIDQRLRASRNNALSFVNTPNFKELQEVWMLNRKAQYHKYYNMFRSYPVRN